ncbi:hypothetical protein HAX54_027559 [Datura stramonium]|uniref:Uncharacterized protein n=1 Tax=Datura stramonium TaxID=4076 RepID=A0ABS8V4N4_DATST|nr:hypothetical protein [Datura stramonium]
MGKIPAIHSSGAQPRVPGAYLDGEVLYWSRFLDTVHCKQCYRRGSHPGYQGTFQNLWYPHDENQGRNDESIAELKSWESEKSSHSNIEGMLEMVLEWVLSTNSGIRELKGDL